MNTYCVILAAAIALCAVGRAGESGRVELPAPTKSGGMELMRALSERRSAREFADADLPAQQLGDLLWAMAGQNRAGGGKTHPTALNRQDMTVYAFTRDGAYRYLPAEHVLEPVAAGDRRADTGMQPFVAGAAVNVAVVQDTGKWQDSEDMAARAGDFGFAHAGAMIQNGYLYAASQGLSAVVRAAFDEAKVKNALGLGDAMRVRLVLSVGPGR